MTQLDSLNQVPAKGDFIAVDWAVCPDKYNGKQLSWYCSEILQVFCIRDKFFYRMSYNNQWQEFKKFGQPKPSRNNTWIFPALS